MHAPPTKPSPPPTLTPIMHHSTQPSIPKMHCSSAASSSQWTVLGLELCSHPAGHLTDVTSWSVVPPPPLAPATADQSQRTLFSAHLKRSELVHLQVVLQSPKGSGSQSRRAPGAAPQGPRTPLKFNTIYTDNNNDVLPAASAPDA